MTAALASPAHGVAHSSLHSVNHAPVLLQEAVEGLRIIPDGIYVDATFGRGGHSALILQRLGPHGRLIAFDRDPDAVRCAEKITDARFQIVHAPFSELQSELAHRGVDQIDGLLADLGVSSPQLEDAQRGFSFRAAGPLDMRMDPTRGIPVSVWIAQASQDDLKKVISDYGEERFAVPIADAIAARCAAAQKGEAEPLESTESLAHLVAETLRRCGARKEPGQHPATRTFQALRIYINREMEELATLLAAAVELLRDSGRVAIISFHSLEDRVVKQFFREHSGKSESAHHSTMSRGQRALAQGIEEHAARGKARSPVALPRLRTVARVRPSADEVARNPRARSATLRIAERVRSIERGAP